MTLDREVRDSHSRPELIAGEADAASARAAKAVEAIERLYPLRTGDLERAQAVADGAPSFSAM